MTEKVADDVLIERKNKISEKIFISEKARERIISIYERRCLDIPRSVDIALVLGTSLKKYPDKFKKRVYTAVDAVNRGITTEIILSGETDHETDDVNQSYDAKQMAINKFGLNPENIVTVGGTNTQENLLLASEYITEEEKGTKTLLLVSSGEHLIRSLILADHIFGEAGIEVYPFPVYGEETLDPNDPKVILETIKAILYNRVLNKNSGPVDPEIREQIDEIAHAYTMETRSMPRIADLTFSEWKEVYINNKVFV